MEGAWEDKQPAACKETTKQWCLQMKHIFYNSRLVCDLQDGGHVRKPHRVLVWLKKKKPHDWKNKSDTWLEKCNSKQCEWWSISLAMEALPCEGGHLMLMLLFLLTGDVWSFSRNPSKREPLWHHTACIPTDPEILSVDLLEANVPSWGWSSVNVKVVWWMIVSPGESKHCETDFTGADPKAPRSTENTDTGIDFWCGDFTHTHSIISAESDWLDNTQK